MTLKELKKVARKEISDWCNFLPEDGDYEVPELITDRWAGNGTSPPDGDYAVIVIFHDSKEGGVK